MKRLFGAVVFAACTGWPLSAAAQELPSESGDAREQARALHEQAMAAYKDGKYADAASAFERAYELSPAPGLLFNLAQAHRARGATSCPEALDAYRRYLDADPEASNRAAVEARIGELEPCAAEERERRAAAAAAAQRIEARSDPAAPPVRAVVPKQKPRDNPQRPVQRASSSSVPWLVVGLAGAGVVAAGIGGALYASAGSDYAELEESCRDECPPDAWEGAADRERAGLALLGVGGAAIAVSLVVWLATGASPGSPPSRGRRTPVLTATW